MTTRSGPPRPTSSQRAAGTRRTSTPPCRASCPSSGKHLPPFTEAAPDDTEGHLGRKGGIIDGTDVEAHILTFGRDTRPVVQVGIEPENGRWSPFLASSQANIQPEGGKHLPPFAEPAPDDTEGHVNRTDPPGVEPESGRRPAP